MTAGLVPAVRHLTLEHTMPSPSMRRVSRRTILRTIPAGVAGLTAGVFTGTAARPSLAANDKLQIACIGTA